MPQTRGGLWETGAQKEQEQGCLGVWLLYQAAPGLTTGAPGPAS